MDDLRSKANGTILIIRDCDFDNKAVSFRYEWENGNMVLLSWDFLEYLNCHVIIDNDFIIHVGPYNLIPVDFDDNCVLAKRVD